METLVNHWINENERQKRVELTVISPYDDKAYEMSKKIKNTEFLWFNSNRWFSKVRNRIFRHIICPIKHIDFYDDCFAQIISLLKKGDYDKIILESRSEMVNTFGRIFGKDKVYCHIHIRPQMTPYIYDNCSKVLAVSQYIKNEIVENALVDPTRVEVLKNCVDLDTFKPNCQHRANVRSKYSLKDDEVAICYVGRLVEMKGIRHLLEAVLSLDRKLKFRLFIVGSLAGHFDAPTGIVSPFMQSIQELSKSLGDKIVYTGFIHNDKLPEFLNGMDIAVMPSKYKEAAPVTNVEFQALGLPVISTTMGGIPEYVTHQSAILVENDENLSLSLTKQIERLILDADLRKSMSDAGIINAKQFSKEQYLDNLIKLL